MQDLNEITQAMLELADAILEDDSISSPTHRSKAKRVKYLAFNAIEEQARQGLDED